MTPMTPWRPDPRRTGRLALRVLVVASLVAGAAGAGAAAPAAAASASDRAVSGRAVPARASAAAAGAARFLGSPTTTVPSAPDFPSWLDPAPGYEAESGCSATETPGALDVARVLRATYGPGYPTNILRGCTAARSGHEEGRAVDWMTDVRVPAEKADADSLVRWLLADDPGDPVARRDVMARRLGVMYLIWDSRFYPVYAARPAWSEYKDCLTVRTAPAADTTCHRNHVHLSLGRAGALRQTSWWTLAGGPGECTVRSVPSVPLPAATSTVTAVARTTVLDTARGIGTPRVPLPCTATANSRLAVRAGGRGPVPARAASLRVELVATGAVRATWVSLTYGGGPGAAAPARLAVPPGTTARRTLTVPVGRTGGLSLDVGPGAVDVRVDVLGYRAALGTGARRPVVVDTGAGTGRVSRS